MLQSAGELLKQRGLDKIVHWHLCRPPEANRRLVLCRGWIFLPLSYSACTQLLQPSSRCTLPFLMETALTWDETKMTASALCSQDLQHVPVSAGSRVVLGPSKPTFFLATGFMIYQNQTSQLGRGKNPNLRCAYLCNLADVGHCHKAL